LDKLEDKPKSVKEAHDWLIEQQDLNQRILESAVALKNKLDHDHLEERANIQTTYAIGYIVVEYPESSFPGTRRPTLTLVPLRKKPLKVTLRVMLTEFGISFARTTNSTCFKFISILV
jgi:hypothetical protein